MLQQILDFIPRPDIPFSREDGNRYLPWVIAVMVCLVGLLLTVGISLHQATTRAGQLNLQSFQVYVPYEHSTEALNKAITTLLRDDEAVLSASPVSTQTLEEDIAPWTRDAISLEGLPLPFVLEVTLKPQVNRNDVLARIDAALKQANAAIEVESYQEWVDQLARFTGTLRLGVFALVALLLAALLGLIAIIVRTSLMLNFQSVRLLHHMGATDEYILRQFVMNGCLLVLKGSAMGMGLASMIAVLVSSISVEWSSPLLPSLALGSVHLAALVFLPVMVVALAAVMVRLTITKMLELMH